MARNGAAWRGVGAEWTGVEVSQGVAVAGSPEVKAGHMSGRVVDGAWYVPGGGRKWLRVDGKWTGMGGAAVARSHEEQHASREGTERGSDGGTAAALQRWSRVAAVATTGDLEQHA
ncbi:unnamed protein product [Closterium sp. NIES-64]|nr:unnamed protein product [Closterium sp. NIES-64]CAI5979706.1 unnamed protein product [Closterium sp. NIES-64]